MSTTALHIIQLVQSLPDADQRAISEALTRSLVERGDIEKAIALEVSPNPDQLKMVLKGIRVSAPGIL